MEPLVTATMHLLCKPVIIAQGLVDVIVVRLYVSKIEQ